MAHQFPQRQIEYFTNRFEREYESLCDSVEVFTVTGNSEWLDDAVESLWKLNHFERCIAVYSAYLPEEK